MSRLRQFAAPLVCVSFAGVPVFVVHHPILVFSETSWIWWLRTTKNQRLWARILWEGTAHPIIRINMEIQNFIIIRELEARCHTEVRIRLLTSGICLKTWQVRNTNNRRLCRCAFTSLGSNRQLRRCAFTSFASLGSNRRSRYDARAVRHEINLFVRCKRISMRRCIPIGIQINQCTRSRCNRRSGRRQFPGRGRRRQQKLFLVCFLSDSTHSRDALSLLFLRIFSYFRCAE